MEIKGEVKMLSSSGKKTSVTFNPKTSQHIVKYDGKSIETTVTNRVDVIVEWARKNCQKKGEVTVVGFAMRFNHNQDKDKAKAAATLQLYIDGKCLILQLLHMDKYNHGASFFSTPNVFSSFIEGPMFIFAGIEVDKSIETLQKLCYKRAFKTLDIMEGARIRWPEKYSKGAGLNVLAREVANMHIDLPHHVSLSKWDASVLFLEQVEYATMEAYASYCVAHKLLIGE